MFLLSVYLFFMKILGSRKYMYKLVNSVENVCSLDGYTDFIFANYFVFPTLLGEAGSDCSSCIVLFDPLPALSLCLLHDIDTCSACISPLIKKHWIKQVIDQYFFHHCIMTLIPSVTVARTYYVRSVSSMLKNLETVQVPGLHLKRNYLVTRKKFKLTKLERKKIHYYKDKLCATWYRCSHRRPSSDE